MLMPTRLIVSTIVVLMLAVVSSIQSAGAEAVDIEQQKREYLNSILYSREAVQDWLAGKVVWGEPYHPVLGWVHNERVIQHGVGNSYAHYHYDPDGARHVMAYGDRPCRINTYGNSFTSCEQVNDGETWQEYLAVHLQEPIRNFGIGGYSVYQSYRRMLLEEPKTPAPYIIFNIFSDDHYRNLTGWRNIRLGITPEVRKEVSSPPLPYVKVNPAKDEFIECDNPCPTPESVYNLCDADWVYEAFKDNFQLKITMAERNLRANTPEYSYPEIQALAAEHGLKMEINSPESLKEAIDKLFLNAALFASMRIVDKVEDYAAKNNKKVLYVLSYQNSDFLDSVRTGKRFDQPFIDFLNQKNLPYVDLMQAHLEDFAQYKISSEDYVKLYWIGHYAPRGNFFEAFAVKDKLVEMLDPKPLSYSPQGVVTFESPWEGGKKNRQ